MSGKPPCLETPALTLQCEQRCYDKLFYSYGVKILSELTLSRQGPPAMVRPVPWLCTERILSEQKACFRGYT